MHYMEIYAKNSNFKRIPCLLLICSVGKNVNQKAKTGSAVENQALKKI